MNITRHLTEISQREPEARRQALAEILTSEGLSFRLQEAEPSFGSPLGVRNVILDPPAAVPSPLFCAHYDAVPGSSGANDNGAAVCILIDLALELRRRGISARFVFFDGEETKNAGSRLYVSQLNRADLTSVINLDVCGYGDTLVICGKGHEKKAILQPFCGREILARYQGQLVRYLPPSDDASFRSTRIPTLSMAMVPRWDVQYLKTLATYGEGFLGRPPEFDLIMGQMEVITTMHGGFRDDPKYVEPDTMERMYHYLLEAVQAKPAARKRFGLF